MKTFLSCLAVTFTLTLLPAHAESFKEMFPEDYGLLSAEEQARADKMALQTGKISIDGGRAEVTIPDDYYFLGAEDSAYVIVDIWGNPSAEGTLGMIFPAAHSPYGSGWGVEMSFEEMGYVSDGDADGYDYDDLLRQMQRDTKQSSKEREAQGYGSVALLGWAEPPHYDKSERKLYWAKRLQFGDVDGETLNYNIRVLGRHGVMVVNFIAGMDELESVRAAAPEVMKMVSFAEGNRYADYVPGVDTVAAVGIGGLIAGKVAAKTGLLVLLLAFAKKFIFLLLIPVAILWQKVKSFFSGGRHS
ncbi:DUF2167 domain-containing protein [Frigidibacter sp. SD6-1]|uniref:DUF2167 domain-containing protein n=1 Tax=Frigidibacter sp. SD6-1 TaxID=3032581 RepID=UPI0024DF60B4|nr:DUF2167 domain-containing protein [Frigidibacter sp. SD6-1]